MTHDLAWKVVLREAKTFLIGYLSIDLEKKIMKHVSEKNLRL